LPDKDEGLNILLRRFDYSFFENFTPTVRTFRWLLQNVIRHAWIGARDAIKDVIERNLCPFWIAVLAGFNQPLRLAKNRDVDDYDVLLFW
jgi:hypothetical protein